ncbi:MAG: hypothetical protein KBE65_19110 [Phycisphaerae bacterium]|nr:hypothetical protein [Phycisphaerae bacterium]
MARFSSDVDILKYEPALFGELHLPSQVRASGAGATLSGTTLTTAGADFIAAGVEAGGVVYLHSADGALDGAYEIVSVDSATQLTVSVLRADAADPAIAPPAGSNVSYRISTFDPQATDAALQLSEHFGIQPGNSASDISIEDITGTEGLRRTSALAVIAQVCATWAKGTRDECLRHKSEHYQGLFEKARQRCHLSVDLGADGVADICRVGGVVRLVRD